MGLIETLKNLVLKNGGTESDVENFGNYPDVLEDTAKYIAEAGKRSRMTSDPITVTPRNSVRSMGQVVDSVCDFITPDRFKIAKVSKRPVVVRLVKCTPGNSAEGILGELARRNLTPASVNALLGLAADHPRYHRKYANIIAVDMDHVFADNHGNDCLLCLTTKNEVATELSIASPSSFFDESWWILVADK